MVAAAHHIHLAPAGRRERGRGMDGRCVWGSAGNSKAQQRMQAPPAGPTRVPVARLGQGTPLLFHATTLRTHLSMSSAPLPPVLLPPPPGRIICRFSCARCSTCRGDAGASGGSQPVPDKAPPALMHATDSGAAGVATAATCSTPPDQTTSVQSAAALADHGGAPAPTLSAYRLSSCME